MIEPTPEELAEIEEQLEIDRLLSGDREDYQIESWGDVSMCLVDMYAELQDLQEEIQRNFEMLPATLYFLGMMKTTLDSMGSLTDEAIFLVDPEYIQEEE